MDTAEKPPKKEGQKKRGATSLVERVVQLDPDADKPKFGGIGSRPKSDDDQPKRDPSAMGPPAKPVEEKPKAKGIGIGSAEARAAKSDGDEAEQTEAAAESEKPKFGGIGSSDQRGKSRAIGGSGTANKLVDSLGKPIEPIRSTRPKPGQSTPASSGDASAEARPAAPKEAPAKVAQAKATKARQAKKRQAQDVDLIALREAGYITPDMPPNLMAEEFRIIKRSIVMNAFAQGDNKIENGNVVMVTSSNPSEGKTFCAINLALSIATEQDVTVLLIDADFSKPEILNRLGVSGGRGLMDVVADDSFDLADCLVRTNIPNLVLLPAGRQHNLTTELLASDRMKKIVGEISTRYPDRLVIFDSPPVLASSAASVLALYMGQTVFVIEAERTTEPQIKESLNMVSSCENISLLLNKTKFGGGNKKFATYYGYGGR